MTPIPPIGRGYGRGTGTLFMPGTHAQVGTTHEEDGIELSNVLAVAVYGAWLEHLEAK